MEYLKITDLPLKILIFLITFSSVSSQVSDSLCENSNIFLLRTDQINTA